VAYGSAELVAFAMFKGGEQFAFDGQPVVDRDGAGLPSLLRRHGGIFGAIDLEDPTVKNELDGPNPRLMILTFCHHDERI
jgi:hypothetical protein